MKGRNAQRPARRNFRERSSVAIKLIKNHAVDFLGSDTHNTEDRAPNLGPAIEKIMKKTDEEIMDRFMYYEETYAPRG